MKKIRIPLEVGLLSAFFIFGGAGCHFAVGTAQRPDTRSTLKVRLASEPVSLDPSYAEDGASFEVLYNLGEGLVGYDSKGQIENRLAESYHVSSDGKRYEFTLRKDLKWSDGQPVLPAHFMEAFRRILRPQTTSKLASLFKPIQEIREEKGKLILELKEPTPYWVKVLALPPAFPIRRDILDENQGNWPETAPVVGAYRLSSHLLDQKIILERNQQYWGTTPEIERVEFLVVSDETTGLHLFESGKLDILTRLNSFHVEL